MKVLRPIVAVAFLAFTTPAWASSPMGVFARVDKVVFEPSEAEATKVQIHGAFALHKGPPSRGFDYSEPMTGYMYLTCPLGMESECRLQWQDIKGYIGKQQCAGFGQQLRSFGTVRAHNAAPVQPDTYDLGMGVSGASSAGGMCPRLLAFDKPVSDAGGDGNAPPPPATASPAGTTTAPAQPSTPAPGPSAPATPATPAGSSGGCAATPSSPVSSSALALVFGLAGLAAVSRRRTRRMD